MASQQAPAWTVCFISVLQAQGVEVGLVAKLAGHKNAVVTLSQWNNVDELKADPSTPPDVVYTKDFGKVHFANDRMAFTLAVAPEGTTIPPPDSVATVDQLDPTTDAVSPTTSLDISGLTGSSTTVAGATDSTVAGSTSSTVAGSTDSTSTTVAGATNSTATTVP